MIPDLSCSIFFKNFDYCSDWQIQVLNREVGLGCNLRILYVHNFCMLDSKTVKGRISLVKCLPRLFSYGNFLDFLFVKLFLFLIGSASKSRGKKGKILSFILAWEFILQSKSRFCMLISFLSFEYLAQFSPYFSLKLPRRRRRRVFDGRTKTVLRCYA